jgi:hypothetical protein
MQIGFFMVDEDRRAFHDYIFSRGGYLVPQRWSTRSVPIISSWIDEHDECRLLKIYKSELFPQSRFQDPAWVTWHAPTQKFFVHGPGIEYRVPFTDARGMHRGRLYMGLVSPSSFVAPNESPVGAYAGHRESYKVLENFYKSCARYIRSNYRRDDAGFYHGKGSDAVVASVGTPKVQI